MPCIRTFLVDLFFLAKTYKMVDKAKAAIAHLLMKQEGIWKDVYTEPRLYLCFAYQLQCGDLARDALKQLVGSNLLLPTSVSRSGIPEELFEAAKEAHNDLARLILTLYQDIFKNIADPNNILCSELQVVQSSSQQRVVVSAQRGRKLARIVSAELTRLLRALLEPPYEQCMEMGVAPKIPTGFDAGLYSDLRSAAEQADIGILAPTFLAQLAGDYEEDVLLLRQVSTIFMRQLAPVFKASFLFAICDHQCEDGCGNCEPSEGGPYDEDIDDDDDPRGYIPHWCIHKQNEPGEYHKHSEWSTFQSRRAKHKVDDRFTYLVTGIDLRRSFAGSKKHTECVLDKPRGSSKASASGYSKAEAIGEEQRALMSAVMAGQADVYDNSLPQFRPETDAKHQNEHY